MPHREDLIHVAVRRHLSQSGWTLLAGQYPGGSNDQLGRLYVRDPAVARDRSPDPRRHSLATFVPDLVAWKNGIVLLVEMKPTFSVADAEKLREVTGARFEDLKRALHEQLGVDVRDTSQVRVALGFSHDVPFERLPGVTLLRVESVDIVHEESSP